MGQQNTRRLAVALGMMIFLGTAIASQALASRGGLPTAHSTLARDGAAPAPSVTDDDRCGVVVEIGRMPVDPGRAARPDDCDEAPAVDRAPETEALEGTARCDTGGGHFLALFYLALLVWYAIGSLLMSALWRRDERR